MKSLKNYINNSQWVFSPKEDISVFGGASLIALILGCFIDSFGDYFWMYILYDQPHVYTTYFYTYGSKRFSKKFKIALTLIPIAFFIFALSLVKFVSTFSLTMFLAYYSIFHFVKQQCAWFFISAGKDCTRSSFEKRLDQIVIYSAIFTPAFLSMTEHIGKKGWRYPNDFFVLPEWIVLPLTLLWGGSLLIYTGFNIRKYLRSGIINVGKHFHLLNGMLIWVIYRLEPFHGAGVFGLLLLVFGHSTPYVFLGHKYMRAQQSKGESFFLILTSPKLMMPLLILMTIGLSYFEVQIRNVFYDNVTVRCLLLTAVFTHFTLDSFIWRSDVHPEGLSFLRDSKKPAQAELSPQ